MLQECLSCIICHSASPEHQLGMLNTVLVNRRLNIAVNYMQLLITVSNRHIRYYYSFNVHIFGYSLWQTAGCATSLEPTSYNEPNAAFITHCFARWSSVTSLEQFPRHNSPMKDLLHKGRQHFQAHLLCSWKHSVQKRQTVCNSLQLSSTVILGLLP